MLDVQKTLLDTCVSGTRYRLDNTLGRMRGEEEGYIDSYGASLLKPTKVVAVTSSDVKSVGELITMAE